jgi:hypothetical protein
MINIYYTRRFLAEIKAGLPRLGLRDKRQLIATADELADEVERLQKQLADAGHYKELYTSLSTDWNAVCAAVSVAGIDVSCPGPSYTDWRWRCPDDASGTDATMGTAMAAALTYRLRSKESS